MEHHAKHPRPSPPWADLPGDALGEIAGRLHEAADFVRFHAACRPWREAAPPPPRSFLPCLIKLDDGSLDTGALLHLHSPFARKTRRPPSSWAVAALRGKILECLDVAGGRVLAVGCSHDVDRTAMLINPLTGDATSLPPLPENISPRDAWQYPSGVISNNGHIVLHTWSQLPLTAVLLRPGETNWEDVDISCAMDMDLCSDEFVRRVTVLCSSGVLQGGTRAMAKLPHLLPEGHRYVVESQGELLYIDVHEIQECLEGGQLGKLHLAVSVHALEVRNDGRPQWVERDHGRGIDHMCLFLNWRSSSSFAIDAREFTGAKVTGDGGCAFPGAELQGSSELGQDNWKSPPCSNVLLGCSGDRSIHTVLHRPPADQRAACDDDDEPLAGWPLRLAVPSLLRQAAGVEAHWRSPFRGRTQTPYGTGTEAALRSAEASTLEEPNSMCGVYRYSFKGRKTEVVDELLAPFNRTSMWYMPRPRISHVLSRLHDF
ncbi:hypothetical protein ACP70R_000438 [Stipagrostis hirtigluma subsp. patula]